MQAFPKKRGILAVFLSDLQSEYNHTLLEGITKQANTLHYDIVTFSFFSNTNRDTPFQTGEENILSLFHKGYADAFSPKRACFKSQKCGSESTRSVWNPVCRFWILERKTVTRCIRFGMTGRFSAIW